MDRDKPDAWRWSQYSPDGYFLKDSVIQVIEDILYQGLIALKINMIIFLLTTPPNFQPASIKAVMLSEFVVLPTSDSLLDQVSMSDAISIPKMQIKNMLFLPIE